MDATEYLAALRRDGDAIGDAAQQAFFASPVESCPGWSVADLLWHVTEVHGFWAAIVSNRATSRDQVAQIQRAERVPDDRLLSTYTSGLDHLVDLLGTTDPAIEVWTWADEHDVAFVIRRLAHETAVHRWDVERAIASGTSSRPPNDISNDVSIEATLASDGIDEFLTHFVDDIRDDAEPVGGSVHIHCTDIAGEWTVRPNAAEDGFVVAREHAKGDCAMRGHASDLLLALWRRVEVDRIEVIGDAAVAERFLAAPNLS